MKIQECPKSFIHLPRTGLVLLKHTVWVVREELGLTLMRGPNTRFINSVFYNNFSISCVLIGSFISSLRVQMDKI